VHWRRFNNKKQHYYTRMRDARLSQ